MEYVQEEDGLTNVLDEEEKITALFTSFGYLLVTPNHKNMDSYKHELAIKIHNS